MEIYERINILIKKRNITKRKFSEILQNLQPKLKSTGEIPSEKTIYKYLNGSITIPIELISYISEALDIPEQELFDTNINTKIKLYKYISKDLGNEQLTIFNNLVSNASVIKDIKANYNKHIKSESSFHNQEEIDKFLSLLEYAPRPLIKKLILKLEEIKKLTLKDI